ncbi:MAG: tellurite resistance TerB family protein [Alphaproteobacteria bacterium]|nr:tellurite resistance TerB family protein [Alphaproteobacteria bacterium]
MIDMNGILGALQSNTGRNTAMVGGGAALAGLAAGMLTGKSGRKMMGKAAKYGAVAALGGLAYHAISRRNGQPGQQPAGQTAQGQIQQQHQLGHSPAAAAPMIQDADYTIPPAGSAYLPPADDDAAQTRHAKSLIRAMIAAAKADGRISDVEYGRIMRRTTEAGLDPESRAYLEAELSRPMNMDEVVQDVMSPEHAAEIYAASLVAIEADGAVEKAYLQMLAARLGLDADLVAEIHRAASEAEASAMAV